jgi:hypothetical protein
MTEEHHTSATDESVALRDFNPGYDRLGSSATDAVEAARAYMSVSLRKRTNSRRLGYVRFVP